MIRVEFKDIISVNSHNVENTHVIVEASGEIKPDGTIHDIYIDKIWDKDNSRSIYMNELSVNELSELMLNIQKEISKKNGEDNDTLFLQFGY